MAPLHNSGVRRIILSAYHSCIRGKGPSFCGCNFLFGGKCVGTNGKNLIVGGRNLTGQRFGRLTVTKEAGRDAQKRALWLCKCDCGNEKIVASYLLKRGSVKSCGCYAAEVRHSPNTFAVTHGGYKTRLYKTWESMRQRCNNKNSSGYNSYGGRGIRVCDEWSDFGSFRDWAYANGYDDTAPKGRCTLDRIDNDGDYEPSNCRWVDSKTQAQNRSATHKYEYNGEILSIRELSDKTGVNYSLLYRRIIVDGIDVYSAVSIPKQSKRGKLQEALRNRSDVKVAD